MAAAAAFGRTKRVTDMLDEKVRARLCGDDDRRYLQGGYASSDSEHEGASALSGLIDGFFFDDNDGREEADDRREEAEGSESGEDLDRRTSGFFHPVPAEMIRDLISPAGDGFRKDLAADVKEAAEKMEGLRPSRSAFRRAVMASLRELGYNAGICKSRWESSGGITAGSYEYIDVVRPPAAEGKGERYIVDVEFAGEFEIARPTAEYERVVEELPRVYVGRAEELKQALRVLAEEAKKSLRSRDLHLPPWRKARYMQAKWLGPYKRTTNAAPCWPSSSAAAAAATAVAVPKTSFGQGRDVQCRAVGFVPACIFMPPVARTR